MSLLCFTTYATDGCKRKAGRAESTANVPTLNKDLEPGNAQSQERKVEILPDSVADGQCNNSISFLKYDRVLKRTNVELRFALEDLTGYDLGSVVAKLAPNPGTHTYPSSTGDLAWDKITIDKQLEFAEEVALRLQRDLSFRKRFNGNPNATSEEKAQFVSAVSQLFLAGQASDELIDKLQAGFQNNEPTIEEKFNAGVRDLIFRLILDPLFLYDLNVTETPTPLDTAKRLAAVIWKSVPDPALLLAAASGKLSKVEDVEKQIDLMLESPKAMRAFESFTKEWLATESLRNTQRNKMLFPEFNPALMEAMEEDLIFQVKSVLFEADQSPIELFKFKPSRINALLAPVYGITATAPQGTKTLEVSLGNERQGILTHPAVATMLSAGDSSNAVKRSTYALKRFLCIELPPPPPDGGVFTQLNLPADATLREKFGAHTKNPSCSSCHSVLDGVGFALEEYDALGKFRKQYPTLRTIDPSGSLLINKEKIDFQNAIEMQTKIAEVAGEQVQSCFVSNVLENALRSPVDDALRCEVKKLSNETRGRGYKSMIKRILLSEVFWRSYNR